MNKEIAEKQIKNAVNKNVRKTVDNLLVYVLVIDGDTGKVLDIVRKPGHLTGNLTGYPQSEMSIIGMISALRTQGYTVTKLET